MTSANRKRAKSFMGASWRTECVECEGSGARPYAAIRKGASLYASLSPAGPGLWSQTIRTMGAAHLQGTHPGES